MEYSKNTEYGKIICYRCLISPDREEAAIFIGMNKVISRALDADGVSIYPCKSSIGLHVLMIKKLLKT
jgi:hypothetical protein